MMDFNLLPAPILLPLAVGVLILLIPKGLKWVREALALLASVLCFLAAWQIFFLKASGLKLALLSIGGFNVSFDLAAGPLSSVLLLFATGFAVLICIYSLSYLAGRPGSKEYYACFLFALGGAGGVLLADHLLLFLIFWEMVTASLYFLITTGTPEAREGATKTFVMLGGADGCLLLGLGLLWYLSGSFGLSEIVIPVQDGLSAAAFILLLVGALTKAGSLPFHTWLPAASRGAPAPVMAFLPAALDKILGIYLLARLATGLFILNQGMSYLLMIIGSLTIVAAVMIAMVQHDLRRLLSYHAVSQAGYMVLGIATMNPIGLAGGLFHLINNSIYKGCLFLCSGAVEKKTGENDLGELGGLAKAMPLSFTCGLIAALAISGVPPFNGFVSKWMIYQAVIKTGSQVSFLFLLAAMFGSALTLASFIKLIYSVFLGQKSEKTTAVQKDVGLAMLLPMILLSLLCLALGIFYPFVIRTFFTPALIREAAPIGVWDSGLATLFILAGLLLGLLLYLVGRVKKTSRVASGFVGGELLSSKLTRVRGSYFYDTIKSMPMLAGLYRTQERGCFDPYLLLGKLGAGITWILRKLHNGFLPWYLSWSLAGIAALLLLGVFLP